MTISGEGGTFLLSHACCVGEKGTPTPRSTSETTQACYAHQKLLFSLACLPLQPIIMSSAPRCFMKRASLLSDVFRYQMQTCREASQRAVTIFCHTMNPQYSPPGHPLRGYNIDTNEDIIACRHSYQYLRHMKWTAACGVDKAEALKG